ncbi:ABC transporter ATP-binding protein [Corynebacterium sp. HMSC075D04]|uniref:ABC transporter ATP-binding protein n=1 Tax=Corynebacterium sp. HMSC075D04 TaxID=1739540 RepID=UPI0009F1CF63|nr:ABC transporter ATP-binding protein [Corynebacterium sp. HMSC075D04]
MQSLNNPSVVVDRVSKVYEIAPDGESYTVPWKTNKLVPAVNPLSFVAHPGESIGILGRNGSGKSTLISMIAGNEAPTTGEVYVSAKPSLLSVSAALQPQLTGADNVRLGLLAKGLSPAEVDELAPSVANWADIGEAIDRPLHTYSSGMGARLKFAIATAVRPKILLLDEALATGDATFNERAKERMNGFLNGASTVFLVSHSASAIRNHCTRALWLHDGSLIADMSAKEAVKWYVKWSRAVVDGKHNDAEHIIRSLAWTHKETKIKIH